jgi:hypothetical protein
MREYGEEAVNLLMEHGYVVKIVSRTELPQPIYEDEHQIAVKGRLGRRS